MRMHPKAHMFYWDFCGVLWPVYLALEPYGQFPESLELSQLHKPTNSGLQLQQGGVLPHVQHLGGECGVYKVCWSCTFVQRCGVYKVG